MRLVRNAWLMALLALSAAPSGAQQQPWAEASAEIKQAFTEQEAGQDIADRRYVLGEKLPPDSEKRHTFDVRKGRTYMVIGVCDDICEDIDIIVEDASGNVLSNDETYGANPFVVFSPQRSGRVSVILTMKECGEDLCEYGLGFYLLAEH